MACWVQHFEKCSVLCKKEVVLQPKVGASVSPSLRPASLLWRFSWLLAGQFHDWNTREKGMVFICSLPGGLSNWEKVLFFYIIRNKLHRFGIHVPVLWCPPQGMVSLGLLFLLTIVLSNSLTVKGNISTVNQSVIWYALHRPVSINLWTYLTGG